MRVLVKASLPYGTSHTLNDSMKLFDVDRLFKLKMFADSKRPLARLDECVGKLWKIRIDVDVRIRIGVVLSNLGESRGASISRRQVLKSSNECLFSDSHGFPRNLETPALNNAAGLLDIFRRPSGSMARITGLASITAQHRSRQRQRPPAEKQGL